MQFIKQLINFRPGVPLITGIAFGLLLGVVCQLTFGPFTLPARAKEAEAQNAPAAAHPQTDISSVEERLPDQSHAMTDVAYHFANLWFAADKQNWPLANYYLSETRSHLRWAVRIHPVRKTKTGFEVDLNGILDAVDNSFLAEVGKAIENKDTARFKAAYRQTIE